MEEIGHNIFIESGFSGVVLGLLKLEKGMIFIDAPFREQDVLAWKEKVSSLDNGGEKLLVMLDPHIDRALGIRLMGMDVLGHQNAIEILNNRPMAARAQEIDAGAEWSPQDLPVNIHWNVPNLSYTSQVCIHWDDEPVIIRHQPGAHMAGSWLEYCPEKVIFIGDSVVTRQPPFIAWADIDRWLEELEYLRSDVFKGYKIVSSRSGVVTKRSIDWMTKFLERIKSLIAELVDEEMRLDAISTAVPLFLKKFRFDQVHEDCFKDRLIWGLDQYLQRHYPKQQGQGKGAS